MKPGEQEALDKLKAAQNDIRRTAFSQCQYFIEASADDLKNAGQKTVEAACLSVIKDAMKKLKEAENDFLWNYPD
jgi:hypothetical protein